MQCPKCEEELTGEEKICKKCGLDLGEYSLEQHTDELDKIFQVVQNEDDVQKAEQLDEHQPEEKYSDSYVDPYMDPYKKTGNQFDYDYDPYEKLRNIQYEPEPQKESKSETSLEPTLEQSEEGSALTQPEKDTYKRKNPILLGGLLGIAIGVGAFALLGDNGDKLKQRLNQIQLVSNKSEKAEDDTQVDMPKSTRSSEAVLTTEATPEPTPIPEPTPTPEPELNWQAAVTKEEQDELLADGTWLDKNHMKSLMDASASRYGLYVMDITNFVDYKIGEAETPLPASALIGIPIMYTIAEGISRGAYSMSDPVIFSYTFVNGRGGFTAEENGQFIALGELLMAGLTFSDNNAWNSLMDYITYDQINAICHQYGYNSVDLQKNITSETTDKENYISAQDAAAMLNAIYQNNFTQIDRDFLYSYFRISPTDSANKGMYPACQNADRFLNLNGITSTRYNEVGLVENGDEVFIIAALTIDGDHTISAPSITNEAAYVLANLKVGER